MRVHAPVWCKWAEDDVSPHGQITRHKPALHFPATPLGTVAWTSTFGMILSVATRAADNAVVGRLPRRLPVRLAHA